MSEDDLPPLDDATLDALRAEKDPPGAPKDVAARVFSRAQASLLVPSPAGPVGESEATRSHGLLSKSGAVAAQHAGRGAATVTGKIVMAFVVGGFVGASGHAWVTRPASLPAEVTSIAHEEPRVAPADRPTAVVVEEATPPAIAESPPIPPLAVASAPVGLSAERALLDQAQRALSRGETAASLVAVQTHLRKFPRGKLEEEREALAIKVLVAAGRYDEAKARGARFRSRFPDGFLLHAVDDALRSIP